MFKYEKEMIPVLINYLKQKHRNGYFLNEFNSGNGIADIVYSTKIKQHGDLILDYELIYIALTYWSKRNKTIDINNVFRHSNITKKKISTLLDLLTANGYIEKINETIYVVKKKYNAPVKNIISIEAKLSDWKNGLQQAMRYKSYSNSSYLAISNDFLHRVDLSLLKEKGIGLIAVHVGGANLILEAKITRPLNEIAHTYLAEKFYSMIA